MKKYLLVVFLFALIIVSGCTKQEQKTEDPKNLLKASIEKSSSVDYKIEYEFNTEFKPVGQPTQFLKTSGILTQTKKGDKIKVATLVNEVSTSGGIQTLLEKSDETIVYILPDGVYQCNKILNSTICAKAEDADVEMMSKLFNTTASLQTIEQSVSSGQVSLKFNQIKTVASRKCYDIEASYQDAVGIRPTNVCLDTETGILLVNSAELKTGSLLNTVNMVAKGLSLEVDDSEFVVPKTT